MDYLTGLNGLQSMSELYEKPMTEPTESDGSNVPQWGVRNPKLYGAYGAGKAIAKTVKPAVSSAGRQFWDILSKIVYRKLMDEGI